MPYLSSFDYSRIGDISLPQSMEFTINYLPAEPGTLEPVVAWVTTIGAFQSLHVGQCDLGIRVSLAHPLSSALSSLQERELYLLQQFARDHPEASYAVRLSATLETPGGAVSYGETSLANSVTEVVTIDLKQLADHPCVGGIPTNVYPTFAQWKKDYLVSRLIERPV